MAGAGNTDCSRNFLVEGYLQTFEQEVLSDDDIIDIALGQELQPKKRETKTRYRWCNQDGATHVTLRGVGGAIAPIGEVEVTGRLQDEARIAHIRASNERRANADNNVF